MRDFAHQIDQHARIEIAAARSHDHPTGRGQTHAGVNGLTAFNGGETGAIAEMRNYQSIRQIVPKLAYKRLARKAVKSIAVDAIRSQFQGERQGARDIWHPSVKRRIEAGHLWQLREVLLREANDRQRRRIMQWREDGCRFELPQHRFVDQAMAARFGPPCTTRCPIAAGWASLQSARNVPMRATASCWVPKFAASETNGLSFASFAQNLPWRSPIDSASPERSTFGMEDSTW